jgi:hypothetical protein
LAYSGAAPPVESARQLPMARQFLGRSLGQWLEYLAAILVGNGIYFLSLLPHLPVVLRHRPGQIDLGLGLDFLVCAALYGLIRVAKRL